MRVFEIIFFTLLFSSSSLADGWKNCGKDSSVPTGDYIPTSVQAEKSRLLAHIQDLHEDLRLASKFKTTVCVAGAIEWAMFSSQVSQLSSDEDIRYLKKQLASLDSFLPRVLRQMSLTSAELDAYQKLQRQELDIVSCAMEVRHAIDSRLFTMAVLERVFKDQIDHHAVQMGQLKDFQESCVIREKRIERDRAVIEASHQLLKWYDLLEKAN